MKIVFIHIAKAAGSSVNRFFMDVLGQDKCATHIESNPNWRDESSRRLLVEGVSFLSGHITYREFSQKLDLRPCFVFTFLRDPRAQVLSHLAWIRKLSEPAEIARFSAHPSYIQELALKLSAVEFQSPAQVKGLVDALTPVERALLDNPQVRYLRCGQNQGLVTESDVEEALGTLRRLNAYGFVSDLGGGLKEIKESLGFATPAVVHNENALVEKYGMSFTNADLMNALDELIRYDLKLYDAASALKTNYVSLDRS